MYDDVAVDIVLKTLAISYFAINSASLQQNISGLILISKTKQSFTNRLVTPKLKTIFHFLTVFKKYNRGKLYLLNKSFFIKSFRLKNFQRSSMVNDNVNKTSLKY